jgi:hypothetical protein
VSEEVCYHGCKSYYDEFGRTWENMAELYLIYYPDNCLEALKKSMNFRIATSHLMCELGTS